MQCGGVAVADGLLTGGLLVDSVKGEVNLYELTAVSGHVFVPNCVGLRIN